MIKNLSKMGEKNINMPEKNINMPEIGAKKEVFYDKYCEKCQFSTKNEDEWPCFPCLKQPYNYDSHRPIKFVPAKK